MQFPCASIKAMLGLTDLFFHEEENVHQRWIMMDFFFVETKIVKMTFINKKISFSRYLGSYLL